MNPITEGIQPALKLWGEEEVDGAIYAVYLKKVRYHHAKVDPIERVSHLEWETIRVKMIKAGTLMKLVESLATESGELESTYMNIFLATYRSFATPRQVLRALFNRYELVHNDAQLSPEFKDMHKNTLERVLLVWLDMYPEDFYEPPQFLSLIKIREFAEKYMNSNNGVHMRMKHKLLKYNKNNYSVMIKNVSLSNSNGVKGGIYQSKYSTIFDITNRDFALQLTFSDNELFKRLVPYQCLGSSWSSRNKDHGWNVSPYTVTATVKQFNAVSLRVISTILSNVSQKPVLRGRIITKWINIAQELRLLKNFSSLKAITAALQSNPIHRLTKTWLSVSRDKYESFSELAKIFSEENNQTNCRELLMKEGSAKFVNTNFSNHKIGSKGSDKMSRDIAHTMQGTIPYLGTFLTDLTMIDTAIQDHLPNGYINFEKKRKEFEILAQIKLLQSAANSYDIKVDPEFQSWFRSLKVYGDKESHELSCLIDRQDNLPTKKNAIGSITNNMFKWSHQKCDSYSSTSSISPLSTKKSEDLKTSKTSYYKLSKSCSNLSSAHALHSIESSIPERDFYIIKVSLEQKICDIKGMNVYKSILLNNSDRTRAVIQNAMSKHGIEGNPDDYLLVQLVPGGEIVFPEWANVYYAVNRDHDFKFVLRLRYNSPNYKKKKDRTP